MFHSSVCAHSYHSFWLNVLFGAILTVINWKFLLSELPTVLLLVCLSNVVSVFAFQIVYLSYLLSKAPIQRSQLLDSNVVKLT